MLYSGTSSLSYTGFANILFHFMGFLLTFVSFFKFFVLLFTCSCLHFPATTSPCPPPTLNPSPLWLCPWVLYTCSLMTFSLLSLIIPSTLPSGHCLFVLYFNVSGYILLPWLFCWLGSTYRWDHMVFAFTTQLISLSIMLSSSIHAVSKGIFWLSWCFLLKCTNLNFWWSPNYLFFCFIICVFICIWDYCLTQGQEALLPCFLLRFSYYF